MNEKLKQLENKFKEIVITTTQMRYTFDKVIVDYEVDEVGVVFDSNSSLSITIWYTIIDEDNWDTQYDFSGVNQFFSSNDLNELKNITHNLAPYVYGYLEEYKKDLGLVECVITESKNKVVKYSNSEIERDCKALVKDCKKAGVTYSYDELEEYFIDNFDVSMDEARFWSEYTQNLYPGIIDDNE